MSNRRALVVGATGLTGRNAAEHLAASGWEVYGMSRHPGAEADGVRPVAGDALDPASVTAVAEQVRATHLFYCTWLRQDTEDLNIEVNGAMTRNTLGRRRSGRERLEHVALVTGLKHYLGPFEAYAQNPAEAAVPGEPAAPGLQELLLRPGGHPLRGGREVRLQLVGPPAAHGHRLRARQRHEHGRDPRRLRHDRPRDRPAVRLPGLAGAVRRDDRHHRRAAPGPPPGLGGHVTGRRERGRSTSSTATPSTGGRCGRSSRRASGVEPAPYPGHPTPLVEQMADAPAGLAGDRRAVRRSSEPDVEPARAVVAHRQRPRPHGRDLRRHDQEPGGRLLRRPGQPPLVPGPVRPAPAGAGHPRGGSPMKAVQFQGVDKLALAEIDATEDRRRRGAGDAAVGGHLPLRLRAARRALHHPVRLPDHPGPRVGRAGRRGRPGRHRLQARRPRAGRVRHRDGALRLLHLRCRGRVLRRAARVAAQGARGAERHPGRARRAVQLRLLRRHARGQPQRQRHRRRLRRRARSG